MNEQNLAQEIRNKLTDLEKRRVELQSEVKSNCVKFVFVPIILIVVLIFAFRDSFEAINFQFKFIPLFAIIFISLIYLGVMCFKFYNNAKHKYNNQYKTVLVKPLMTGLFPDMDYFAKGVMPEDVFRASGLFTHDFNRYTGDDYFEGVVQDTPVAFSELDVKVVRQNSSGSGNSTSNIFSGLFLFARINKNIKSRIVIDPIVLDNMPMPDFIRNLAQKFMPNYGKVIKTGIDAFDTNFKLHCEDENEALKIITPELIKKITEVSDKMKERLYSNQNSSFGKMFEHGSMLKLSVYEQSFYFALGGTKLFDLKFNKSALDSDRELTQSIANLNMLIDIAKLV